MKETKNKKSVRLEIKLNLLKKIQQVKHLKKMFHDFFWGGSNPINAFSSSLLIPLNVLNNIRLFIALYISLLVIVENTEEQFSTISNLQFLTIWGVYINCAYFWTSQFPQLWQISHMLFEVGFSIQLPIVIIYWLAVFPTVQKREDDWTWWLQTISEHGVMMLFLYIDTIFNGVRFYKRHLFLLLGFMGIYLSVNLVVSILHKPVYKPIDWISLMSYVYTVTAIVLGLAQFLLGDLIYRVFKKKYILNPEYGFELEHFPKNKRLRKIKSDEDFFNLKDNGYNSDGHLPKKYQEKIASMMNSKTQVSFMNEKESKKTK